MSYLKGLKGIIAGIKNTTDSYQQCFNTRVKGLTPTIFVDVTDVSGNALSNFHQLKN